MSWKELQKIDGECNQDTHSQHTSVQYSLFTSAGTHRTRLAQELHNFFLRLKRICHLVRTCLTLSCSLTWRLPRAHRLPHSLFLLPRQQNTQHNRNSTTISKNNQDIMNFSRLSQSTSSAIKNHSGVKTCRVAETRARQLSQRAPKTFRKRKRPCQHSLGTSVRLSSPDALSPCRPWTQYFHHAVKIVLWRDLLFYWTVRLENLIKSCGVCMSACRCAEGALNYTYARNVCGVRDCVFTTLTECVATPSVSPKSPTEWAWMTASKRRCAIADEGASTRTLTFLCLCSERHSGDEKPS